MIKLRRENLIKMKQLELKRLVIRLEGKDRKGLIGAYEYRVYLFTRYPNIKWPKCKCCKTHPVVLFYRDLSFREYCKNKTCLNSIRTKKIRKFYTNEYGPGITNVSQLEFIKKEKIATCLKTHGVRYPQQSKKVRKLLISNNIAKYGVGNVSQVKIFQDRRNETFDTKFGGNPYANKYIQNKIKKINLKRRGFEYPSQDPNVKAKIRKTNMRLYGGPSPSNSLIIRKRQQATMMANYGVKYASQDIDIFDKQQRKAFSTKYAISDTQHILPLRGYEPYVVENIHNLNRYKIGSIRNFDLPTIWYNRLDETNNRHKSRYYPDFVVVSKTNKLCVVEVKSTFTLGINYGLKLKNNISKFKAAKETLGRIGVIFKVALYIEGREPRTIWIPDTAYASQSKLRSFLNKYNITR